MRHGKWATMATVVGTMAGLGVMATGPASAQDKELTFAVITHAQPGDTFWDIIRKGATAAAEKDHAKLIYLSAPEGPKEAQLIQNVIDQHVDGIALTLAFPDAEASAVKAAQAAGIPIVGFNAGVNQWKAQGLIGYAGQDETVAGKAVGEQLNKDGAKAVVCVDQQQGAVQLEARCQGIKDTFKGKVDVLYVTGYGHADREGSPAGQVAARSVGRLCSDARRALRAGGARRCQRRRQ